MATKPNFATLVLVVATAVALLEGTAATVYFVGDSLGWTVPAGGATVYANWSSQHSFTTGDILVFNFVSGQHDVAKVTKDALDTCNTTSPISLLTVSPANFTISSADDHHFICTFGQHCLGGQKLSVSVSSTSPSSAPASPPTTSPSPSPSPSMAPSPTPSATTSPPPKSPATSPSPPPSATPPASTTSPPPPPATASLPSPPSETTLTPPPPPPPNSAPLKEVAATLTIMFIALGVIF